MVKIAGATCTVHTFNATLITCALALGNDALLKHALSLLRCFAPAGQGVQLSVTVTAGGQTTPFCCYAYSGQMCHDCSHSTSESVQLQQSVL